MVKIIERESEGTQKITKAEAMKIIYNTAGKFFTVEFYKRTTGELRKMTARLGVKKHLKGGELGYDPKSKNLIGCYDVQPEAGYKMINIDGLVYLKADSIEYTVIGN